jgi:hypothetical protein
MRILLRGLCSPLLANTTIPQLSTTAIEAFKHPFYGVYRGFNTGGYN